MASASNGPRQHSNHGQCGLCRQAVPGSRLLKRPIMLELRSSIGKQAQSNYIERWQVVRTLIPEHVSTAIGWKVWQLLSKPLCAPLVQPRPSRSSRANQTGNIIAAYILRCIIQQVDCCPHALPKRISSVLLAKSNQVMFCMPSRSRWQTSTGTVCFLKLYNVAGLVDADWPAAWCIVSFAVVIDARGSITCSS